MVEQTLCDKARENFDSVLNSIIRVNAGALEQVELLGSTEFLEDAIDAAL